jgi:hypothetical protein
MEGMKRKIKINLIINGSFLGSGYGICGKPC